MCYSCPLCRSELIPPVPSIETLEAQSDEMLQTQVEDVMGEKNAVNLKNMSKNEMAVFVHAHMMRKHHQEEDEDLLEEERAREEELGLEPRVTSSLSQVDPLQSSTNLQSMIEEESRSRYENSDTSVQGRWDNLESIERMLDAATVPAHTSSPVDAAAATAASSRSIAPAMMAVPSSSSSSSSSSYESERDYEAFSGLMQALASGNASRYEMSRGQDLNDTDTMFPGGIMIRSHRDANNGGNLMSYSLHPTTTLSPGGTSSRVVMPTTTTVVSTRTSDSGTGANDSTLVNSIVQAPSSRTATQNGLEGID